MATGVAEQLEDPLRAIFTSSQSIMRMDIPPNGKQRAREISWSTTHAIRMVSNLLLFTQQEELSTTQVDLKNLLTRAVSAHTHYLTRSQTTEVELSLPEELPTVRADPKQLETVLSNLIDNGTAAGVGAKGHVKIHITAVPERDKINITVADDGPGIAPEHMEQIFDPFFTTSRTGKGKGLGLSVCRGVVSQHGGRIWAESECGKGSIFHIELPVAVKVTGTDLTGSKGDLSDTNKPGLEAAASQRTALGPSTEPVDTLTGFVEFVIQAPADQMLVLRFYSWLEESASVKVEEFEMMQEADARLRVAIDRPL